MKDQGDLEGVEGGDSTRLLIRMRRSFKKKKKKRNPSRVTIPILAVGSLQSKFARTTYEYVNKT